MTTSSTGFGSEPYFRNGIDFKGICATGPCCHPERPGLKRSWKLRGCRLILDAVEDADFALPEKAQSCALYR